MILPILSGDNTMLSERQPEFDFSNPPEDPIVIAKNIADTMIHNNGLGLAGNQVGIPYRVFAMKSNPVYVCFNPRIIDQTNNDIVLLEEGCLSFPNLFIKIKRPKTIKVRFQMPNGEMVTEKFSGITARCFQHELDHLDGIVFTKKANTFHIEAAKRYKKKLDRKYNVKN